jgi:hypothetical protein
MRIRAIGNSVGILFACVLLSVLNATPQAAPSVSPVAMAEYQRKLQEYTGIHQKYEEEAHTYWSRVAEKRRIRFDKRQREQQIVLDDYVLTQPPVYSGPPRPVDPSAPEGTAPLRLPIPVVADFLTLMAEQFRFAPQLPQNEMEFKRAYVSVAAAAGLTKEQITRVYGFEAGGNGTYDVQAGLESPRPGARAISTALGYNQLLNTNTVELLAEHGDHFIKALQAKAAILSGDAKQRLGNKILVLQRMIAFCRGVPDSWSEHERLANTPAGLGIHALNLDIDIGPLLQTQKLLDSVIFARRKGYDRELTAAELEMMNLTGDGNGFDMVTMPLSMGDKVPTSNFFQPSGFERNPVAIRNNVVSKLLAVTNARMDQEARLQGARDLAAAFY